MSQEPILCACPKCGKRFKVPAELLGKKIVCKGCQTLFAVEPSKTPGTTMDSIPPTGAVAALAGSPATAKPAAPVPAAAGKPTVTAATAAPAPVAPPSDDLGLIPFDPDAVAVGGDGSGPPPDQMISTRGKPMEKVKIESSGPYFVVKLVTTGKMVHVSIEKQLNEYAADGWWLEQVLIFGTDAYAILKRDENAKPAGAPAASAETH